MKIPKISTTMNDFQKFLKDSKFVDVALGLVIATVVRDLCISFTDNIIKPVIDRFLEVMFDLGVGAPTILFGVNFQLSMFISDLLAAFMTLFILYLLLKVYIFFENENPYESANQSHEVLEEILLEIKKINKD